MNWQKWFEDAEHEKITVKCSGVVGGGTRTFTLEELFKNFEARMNSVPETDEEDEEEGDWTNNNSRRKMLLAKQNKIDKKHQKSIDERFVDTEFLIEADSYAQHSLWAEWHEPNPADRFDRDYSKSKHTMVKWEEDSSGKMFVVGKLDNRPVYVDCTWAKLNGHRVCFYHASGQVVDWKMIENWLNKVCYPVWDNGTRYAHTNASNFHHCIDHVINGCKKNKK